MVTWDDLREAEREFNQAAAELRRYTQNPDAWVNCHEEVQNSRKVLIFDGEGHFEMGTHLRSEVQRKHARLAALRESWVRAE